MKDEVFIRGKVPMTKEEVRCVSIAKLAPEKDSIIYDIGAGTGSVSIEMALAYPEGKIYAIERNPEGIELIKQNIGKFDVKNIEIVEGTAPDCLKGLPAPTHVFMGGTGGGLKDIVEAVRKMNPDTRFVMNIITPETLAESLGFAEEIVQMQISRARVAGAYHLMTAENPVYIVTF